MDGTTVDTRTKERRLQCVLMQFGKIQKLMRKTRRSMGSNAEFYMIHACSGIAGKLHSKEEITAS
jgi:hypothetical protein